MISIQLKFCRVDYEPRQWINTSFPDGTSWGAFPHETNSYHVIAHRTGYQDDIWTYAFEHEFCHSFACQFLDDAPSAVLYSLAHGFDCKPATSVREELLAQAVQRFLRTNERPIIGSIDWDKMKSEALALLPK